MTCIKQLIDNEKNKHKYCFILDSVDGLVAKNDASKGFDEFAKIAAGASIASTWCKQTSIALGKRGHMAIFISQVRSEMRDQYSKEPPRQSVATGGYALQHYANSVIQFQPRYKSDLILQNPSLKTIDEKKNPIIGHFAKVLICKSPNEKSNVSLTYPVRYNRSGGNSIWIEKEIVDLLYAWEFVEKKGAWIKPTEDFCELLTENKLNFPDQIQGDNNLFKTLDQDEELCKFLIKYFREQIGA
jgi:RecA/RadA recombinase